MSLREVQQHSCHMLHNDVHVLRQQHSLHKGPTLSRLPTSVQPQNVGCMRTCSSRCTNVTVSLSCGGLGRLATGTCRQQGGTRHDAVALVSGRAAAGPVHAHMHGRHQRGVTCLVGASCAGVTYSARLRLCSAVSGMALMVLGWPQVGMSLRAVGRMPAASGCCG